MTANPLLDKGLRRVAFIDDEPDDALFEILSFKEAGFDAFLLPGSFGGDIDELVHVVQEKADFVVCDNSLQPLKYADFYGAEAVARWYDAQFPAVLVTQFHDDLASSIRLRRRQVPVAFDKKVSNRETISQGVALCLQEFTGVFSPEREPVRTMLSIVRIDRDRRGVYAHVLSWDPEQPVFFPEELLAPLFRDRLAVGDLLTGIVNTGARTADELFFEDLQPASAPLPEDILGKPERT